MDLNNLFSRDDLVISSNLIQCAVHLTTIRYCRTSYLGEVVKARMVAAFVSMNDK